MCIVRCVLGVRAIFHLFSNCIPFVTLSLSLSGGRASFHPRMDLVGMCCVRLRLKTMLCAAVFFLVGLTGRWRLRLSFPQNVVNDWCNPSRPRANVPRRRTEGGACAFCRRSGGHLKPQVGSVLYPEPERRVDRLREKGRQTGDFALTPGSAIIATTTSNHDLTTETTPHPHRPVVHQSGIASLLPIRHATLLRPRMPAPLNIGRSRTTWEPPNKVKKYSPTLHRRPCLCCPSAK